MSTAKTVADYMSVKPVVGNKSNKFSQLLRLFTEFPVHHLPIVDDQNKLIGIVSTNDLPKVFLSLGNRPKPVVLTLDLMDEEVSIADLMTSNPVTISSSAPISAATAIFAEHRFAALPVVDNGILVGILSSKDVMTYLHTQF
jgi:CBS domain-containing membrane protein